MRKSSPYFEVEKTKSVLINQLQEIAELLPSPNETNVIKLKLNLKKAVKLPLKQLQRTFGRVGYVISSSLQKFILKEQGITKYAELSFRKSDLLLKPTGFLELAAIKPLLTYNAKERIFHSKPMNFYALQAFLEQQGYPIVFSILIDFNLPNETISHLKMEMVLREYQEEALHRWSGAKHRGVIVLPTGAGKTIVALEAIRRLAQKTLIVVPTIDLLGQWRDALTNLLHVPNVGILGGGTRQIAPITVSTYDSASLLATKLSTSFGFLIFDEVHHLPSPSYRLAAELSIAPHRLGLTATPERYDELHHDLDRLIGPTVYRIAPSLLEREGYLAPYRIKRISVALKPEETTRYEAYMKIFRDYTQKLDEIEPGWRFDTIVARTVFDPEARNALSNLEKARRVALEASGKIDHLENLLKEHQQAKIIIFSRYTRIVEKVSDLFGIPLITHKTKAAEREQILTAFKEGRFSKIVTGQVLDEGVDVPDASVGIIISGTGSKREFIQRLGRLLRPHKDEALLIELVTKATLEDGLARRRHPDEDEASTSSL